MPTALLWIALPVWAATSLVSLALANFLVRRDAQPSGTSRLPLFLSLAWGLLCVAGLGGGVWLRFAGGNHSEAGVWIALLSSAGFLLLHPSLRSRAMLHLGLNPARSLHTTALYALSTGILFLTVANLLYPYNAVGKLQVPTWSYVGLRIVTLLHFSLLALLAVGWRQTRSWREARQRLQGNSPTFSWPTLGWLCLLLPVDHLLSILLSSLLRFLETTFGVPFSVPTFATPTLTLLTGLLLVIFNTIGAGISEELLFRGTLQPRLGIFWTSVAFLCLHVQYPFPLSLDVFFSSLLLGWLRNTRGLVAAMVLHGLGNALIFLIKALDAGQHLAPGTWGEAGYRAFVVAGLLVSLYGILRWGFRGSRSGRHFLLRALGSFCATLCLLGASGYGLQQGIW